MLCLSFVLLTLMQSGLGMVTETTQNVYDELKAKKTPGDNWFGFGFAFFLGWSHIPAPHLKGRSRNERLFCFALLYIHKTAERVWYVVKYLVMENMLMWGGNKRQRKESLEAERWHSHKSVRKQVHPLKAARFRRSEQPWRLCSDLVNRGKFSFLSVSIISSNQERSKWSCGKQLSCWFPSFKWKQTEETAGENIQGANSWHQLWWHPAQLSLTLRSRVFYCNTRFGHLYCSQRWYQTKYRFLVEMTTLGPFKTARQSGENKGKCACKGPW